MKTKVSNRVQMMRQKQGLTQVELAEKIGVSRQTIISIEKQECVPSVALALELAKYFGCSVDDIFCSS